MAPDTRRCVSSRTAGQACNDATSSRSSRCVICFAVTGARQSLCSERGLQRLIASHLTFSRLEQADIPVHIVTTNLLSGEEVLLSDGDALSAVLASAAIPGVFAPILREGQILVDGGLADNAAIWQAVALGADRVFVLPTGYARALIEPPARPISVVLQALGLLIQRRLINDVAFYADRVELIVLPPLCPVDVSPTDFSQASDLSNEPVRPREAGLTAGTRPRDIRNVCCRCTTTAPMPEHQPTRAASTNPTKCTPARVLEGGQRDGSTGRISSSRSQPRGKPPAITTCLSEGISINSPSSSPFARYDH